VQSYDTHTNHQDFLIQHWLTRQYTQQPFVATHIDLIMNMTFVKLTLEPGTLAAMAMDTMSAGPSAVLPDSSKL